MKGQLAAQVFIYILGIIVVGAILLIGIRALDTLNENKCTAQEAQFATALASAIERNKKYEVSKTEEFTLPCGAERVCFVSRDVVDRYQLSTDDGAELRGLISDEQLRDSIIVLNIVAGDQTNVYLQLADGTFQGVDRFSAAAPIALPAAEPIRCFGGDPASIRFKGKGQLVEVDVP